MLFVIIKAVGYRQIAKSHPTTTLNRYLRLTHPLPIENFIIENVGSLLEEKFFFIKKLCN